MGSAMMDMMFRNACMNLSNGIVNPLDKDILSYAPLPDSLIDPYITQEVDPLQTMNLTNNTLKVWVEESKKANYFTTHFVTLSRMIMNGVATMARGLVTLHIRGEDLEQAPLSIQDLISISSYQFRKSYIGVLQTVKSKPEVSERLLMNQLRWNNTLIKLFKTREKLDSVVRIQGPGNEEGRGKNEVQGLDVKSSDFKVQSSNSLDDEKALPEAEIKSIADSNVSSLESESSKVSGLGSESSELAELSELPALAALGAYGAIRAYGAYRNQSGNGIQRTGNEEGRVKNEVQPVDLKSSEFKVQSSNPSSCEKTFPESEIKSTAESHVPCPGTEIEEHGSSGAVSCEETSEPEENSSFFNHNSSLEDDSSLDETGQNCSDAHGDRHACAGCAAQDASPHVLRSKEEPVNNDSSLPDRPPEYARVLYRALCRSSGNEDGALEFTLDEIYQLLGDPEFCRYEPQLAADFRKALKSAEKLSVPGDWTAC